VSHGRENYRTIPGDWYRDDEYARKWLSMTFDERCESPSPYIGRTAVHTATVWSSRNTPEDNHALLRAYAETGCIGLPDDVVENTMKRLGLVLEIS
jgi:hypothetical protein